MSSCPRIYLQAMTPSVHLAPNKELRTKSPTSKKEEGPKLIVSYFAIFWIKIWTNLLIDDAWWLDDAPRGAAAPGARGKQHPLLPHQHQVSRGFLRFVSRIFNVIQFSI